MDSKGTISIASSGVLYGLVTVGGSLLSKAGYSVLDISFFFIFYSIFVLAPFAIHRDPKIFSKIRSGSKFLLTYAVVNLVILIAQFGSLSLGLAPPTVAFLLYTQPVWTIVLGRYFFKEKVTMLRIGIVALAIFGVILITNPFSYVTNQSFSLANLGYLPTTNLILGESLALVGGLFLSLWVILGKKGRLEQFKEPVSLTFAVRTFSIIPIGIVALGALIFKTRLFLSSSQDFSFTIVYLILFAIFAGVIPDYLFYRGVGNLQAIQAGVILLLEPVSSAILSEIFHIS